jgi:hypothetical protein
MFVGLVQVLLARAKALGVDPDDFIQLAMPMKGEPGYDRYIRENRIPYSFKVKGKWIGLSSFGFTNLHLIAAMSLVSKTKGKADVAKIREASQETGKFIANQTLLRSAGTLWEILTDDKEGSKGERAFFEAQRMYLPGSSLVRTVANLSDPYQREAKTVGDRWKKMIPGMSQQLEPVRTPWGEPVRQKPWFATVGPADYSYARQPDAVEQALAELKMKMPAPADKSFGPAEFPVALEGKELKDYQVEAGREQKKLLDEVVTDESFLSMMKEFREEQDPEAKEQIRLQIAKRLKEMMEETRKGIRDRIVQEKYQSGAAEAMRQSMGR